MQLDKHIVWHEGKITYENRCQLLKQKGIVIWFTGLSGSGKSTLASAVEEYLFKIDKLAYRLDGDNLRYNLNSDLNFSDKDRMENVRRIVEVSALLKDAGIIVLVCCISPHRKMRELARQKIGNDSFIEVYVKASLDACIARDNKGLYKLAKENKIENFTGISAMYEEPISAEIVIDTDSMSVQDAVNNILLKILKMSEFS